MIKRLTLENFQSHKRTEIEFHDGVNAIVGQSDVGKSAIMRALLWVVLNRPLGDEFCSHWGGDTMVEIETDTHQIRRIKGKQLNCYEVEVIESDDDPILFEAMGKAVPDLVSDLLNLSDTNISQQHDGPFLLADSPGDVAKSLNHAVNLTVIDKVTADVKKRLSDASSDVKRTLTSIEELSAEIKEFDFIPELEADIAYAEGLQQIARQGRVNAGSLSALIKEISSQQEDIQHLSKLADLSKLVAEIEELDEQVDDVGETLEALTALLDLIDKTQKRIKRESIRIADANAEFEKLMPDTCPLCERGD